MTGNDDQAVGRRGHGPASDGVGCTRPHTRAYTQMQMDVHLRLLLHLRNLRMGRLSPNAHCAQLHPHGADEALRRHTRTLAQLNYAMG